MGMNHDEYIELSVDNIDDTEDIEFDTYNDEIRINPVLKTHLDDGDKLVWYKDPTIIATWHSNGRLDVPCFDATDVTISAVNFRILKGHWRTKDEHGVGTESNHWLYDDKPISEYLDIYPDFWKANEVKEVQPKKERNTVIRKKKRAKENEVTYEPIKVEVNDWDIEDYNIFKKASSTLKSIICYEVDYSVFEEYSAKALDRFINNNGVYIMLNGTEPYYVGQADTVFDRVLMHISDKHSGKWEKALLFVSKNNELTKDYQDVLEMRLIDETRGRGAKIVNGNDGNKKNASNVYGNNILKYDSIITYIAEASYKLGYDFLVRSTYSNKSVNAIGNNQTELAKDTSRTNVIVTQRWTVEDMMNLLPEKAFGFGTTILDFAIKDGAFLQSAFERSMNNKELIDRFQDPNRRKLYISQYKLFGIIQAATQDDYGIDIYANMNGIIAKEHLIVVDYEKELFDTDNKILKGKSLETLADDIIERFGEQNMKIDYIVGNPPYQKDTGGGKAGGTAIWPAFIDMGKSLKPETMVMITPSRWFTGGNGITQQWRQNWMNDIHIDKIVHYSNASEVFTNNGIAGGVSYFRWKKTPNNYNETDMRKNIIMFESKTKELRQLNKMETFIDNSIQESIIEKVQEYIKNKCNGHSLENIRLGRADNYYSIPNLKCCHDYKSDNDISVRTSEGIKYIDKSIATNLPSGYRACVSGATLEHACESKDGTYKVLCNSFMTLDKDMIASGNYHVFGEFNSEYISNNLIQTLKTKTIRLIILSFTIGISTANSYKYIPLLDFSKSYTDQDLYGLFNLTLEEINYIEKIIKPLE